MAVTVTHPFVSGVADGGDATLVQPSNWNAGHTVTGLGTAAGSNTTDFDAAGAAASAQTAAIAAAATDATTKANAAQAAAIAASDTAGAAAAAQAASWPATTAFDATAPVTQAFGDSAAAGSATHAAHRDHTHGMPANPVAYAAPALTFGTSNSAGAAASAIRTDATILAFDSTVPVTQASGDAAATGSASTAAHRDHVHGMPTILSQAQTLTRGFLGT